MNKMKRLVAIMLLLGSIQMIAQNKDQSFEVKFDFSGAFLKALGPAISNEEITTFEVSRWMIPGIAIDKTVSNKLSIGISVTPSYNIHMEESWGLGIQPTDGNLSLDYQTPWIISFHSKFSPFGNWFYLGVGLQYLAAADYSMLLIRKSPTLLIGQNSYSADVSGEWEYKDALTPAISLGGKFVINEKILVDIGIQIPVSVGKPRSYLH
jgi:hypothetical protein